MAKESSDIPKDIQEVLRRLERWRSAHTGRLPIPKRLWAAAVELARKHGVSPTAQALHLEYGKLKRLLEAAGGVKKSRAAKTARAGPRRAQLAAPPTFMELMTTPAGGQAECVIELEGRRGKVRIQWKGTALDLAGLSRAFWESQ